jgi:hypothetical protein
VERGTTNVSIAADHGVGIADIAVLTCKYLPRILDFFNVLVSGMIRLLSIQMLNLVFAN